MKRSHAIAFAVIGFAIGYGAGYDAGDADGYHEAKAECSDAFHDDAVGEEE